MRKGLKLMVITFCIFLAITLAVFSAEKTYDVKFATYYAPGNPVLEVLRNMFVPMVEEKTNGNVKITVFDNCQLGAELEFTESLRAGSIEMALIGTILENTIPKIKTLLLPFVFRGPDHMVKVLNGPVGQDLLSGFYDVGVVPLSGFSQGAVQMANNVRPVRTLEDVKGLRLRSLQGESFINGIKAIGAIPIILALDEIYTSLQQGLIDGVPNTILNFESYGWLWVDLPLVLLRLIVFTNKHNCPYFV